MLQKSTGMQLRLEPGESFPQLRAVFEMSAKLSYFRLSRLIWLIPISIYSDI